MTKKTISFLFTVLVFLALLTPFWVFKDLLFPFVTSKAFYFRLAMELALPFYAYLVLADDKLRPNLKNPLNLSVLAFLVFNLLAAFLGVNVLKSIWGNFERMGGVFYLGHLVLLYFYVLLLGQLHAGRLRWFLIALVGIGVITSFIDFMVWLTHNHFLLSDPSYPRISTPLGNPIYIGSFLVIPTFVSLFLALQEEVNWKKIVFAVAAVLQVWVIFLSGTRGAVVGLGIGIVLAALLYVLLHPKRLVKLWGGILVGGFAVIVLLLFVFHNHLPQGTMLHRVFNLKDSNSEARLVQWGVALKGFKDYPVLGVGPENYYFIANKYYNPQIYQYDPSWFDKPHNYLIEVLVTSGVLGFLAYAGMLIFGFWILWKAFKKEILLLGEFCVLVAAIVVYEVQNLFVFDTVAASLTFFTLLGFLAYLWHESSRTKSVTPRRSLDSAFLLTVTGLVTVATLYMLYLTNIVGLEAAKAVNYGYAYAAADPQIANNYFQRALSLPLNFDPIQTSSKYADFAIGLANNPGNQSPDFVKQVLEQAVNAQQDAIARVPNDPTAYMELASLYWTQSLNSKSSLNEAAMEAAQKAVALAPNRPDPETTLAQVQLFQNDLNGAELTLEHIVQTVPQDQSAKLQLARLYWVNGHAEQAIQLGQQVLNSGFTPSAVVQIDWLGQAYATLQNWPAAEKIYQLAVKVDPNNISDYWQLAQVEAKLGNKDLALRLANALLQADAQNAKQYQDFINSLK